MKIKVKTEYKDLNLNRIVKIGEIIDVDIERGCYLNNLGYVEIIDNEFNKTIQSLENKTLNGSSIKKATGLNKSILNSSKKKSKK